MKLPYPGLRSFRVDEWPLFFGREGCLDSMINHLAASRFLAVLGSSGSGKSSPVFTGLLRGLELGFFSKAGSRWKILHFRPGGGPLQNMACAMAQYNSSEASDFDIAVLRSFLARGPRSLVDWFCANMRESGESLLLVVDQFEELFRYVDYASREEAEAFVSLLLESIRAEGIPIYVVITMRSEFLGACALLPGLAEQINKSFYLTPRMTREECEDAILGPAEMLGFTVEPALVNQLLNDMANLAPWEEEQTLEQVEILSRRADQLPLMQHVLNRLWLLASLRDQEDQIVLTQQQYEEIGGLTGALDKHGEDVISVLSPAAQADLEWVFRALISGSTPLTAVRRPCRFMELVALTKGGRDTAKEIVDAFRRPESNFLHPQIDTQLEDHTVVDISHESLIRQWKRLEHWLRNEAQAGENWFELQRRAQRYANGPGMLLSGLDLTYMTKWRERDMPSRTWAKRYGNSYDEVQNFLQQSMLEADASIERARVAAEAKRIADEHAKRSSRQRLFAATVAGSLVVGALCGAGVVKSRKYQADMHSANQQTSFVTKERNNTQQDLNVQIAELAATQKDLEGKQSKLNDDEKTLSAQKSQLKTDNENLADQKNQLVKAQKDLDDTKIRDSGEIKVRESDLHDLNGNLDTAKKTISQLTGQLQKQKTLDEAKAIPKLETRTTNLLSTNPQLTVYVANVQTTGKTIYTMKPEVYIDNNPYAYVQPGHYFSTRLPAGPHTLCVTAPFSECQTLDVVLDKSPKYAKIVFQQAVKKSPGFYLFDKSADGRDKPNERITSDNIINMLLIEP